MIVAAWVEKGIRCFTQMWGGTKAATAAAEKRGALKVMWMKGHTYTVSETCDIANHHMPLPHSFVFSNAHVKLDSCSFDPLQRPRLGLESMVSVEEVQRCEKEARSSSAY